MWDERYSAPEYIYGKQPNEFLASLPLKAAKGQKVLCLAEGEGRNAVYLASLGYEVLAIDQSMTGLQKALDLASENGVKIEVEQADLGSYKIPLDTYDGIISIFGHFDPGTRSYIYEQAIKGLKKNGFLAMEVYSKEQLSNDTGGPKSEETLYDLDDLEFIFQGRLEYIIKRKIERNIIEGKYHTGTGSVIQIFALRK